MSKITLEMKSDRINSIISDYCTQDDLKDIEKSIQQIKTLIEAWQLDEADLNQTDINAMQVLLKENQELKKQLEDKTQDYKRKIGKMIK